MKRFYVGDHVKTRFPKDFPLATVTEVITAYRVTYDGSSDPSPNIFRAEELEHSNPDPPKFNIHDRLIDNLRPELSPVLVTAVVYDNGEYVYQIHRLSTGEYIGWVTECNLDDENE